MKQLYLVGYVVQKGSDLGGLGAMMGMSGEGPSYKFGNQKITTEKINLSKIYKIIANKENVGVITITILGISPLPNE